MGRMSCEEWLARIRRSILGSTAPRVVGEMAPGRLDRRESPDLVTVDEFHRECVLALARNASRRGRG